VKEESCEADRCGRARSSVRFMFMWVLQSVGRPALLNGEAGRDKVVQPWPQALTSDRLAASR
jgi:hypothetical protein